MKSTGPYRELYHEPQEPPREPLSPTDFMFNIMLRVPFPEMQHISWKTKIAITSLLLTLGTVIGSANHCAGGIPNQKTIPAASNGGN